jgi:urease accessory protein UreF
METFQVAGSKQTRHTSLMLRLLQRMDDTEPRLPAAGKSLQSRPELTPISVVAEADESRLDALEDWARGLDWVQWLLSGIRQRMDHLHFVSVRSAETRRLHLDWHRFAESSLKGTLAPSFHLAWQAVHQPDLSALFAADEALSKTLSDEESTRSLEAGRLLLKATNRARYQGILGHYRKACETGTTPGHFLILWAAVAHFFQLSLASSIAEYLRLEWALATRHLSATPTMTNLPQLTAQLMKAHAVELRLMT